MSFLIFNLYLRIARLQACCIFSLGVSIHLPALLYIINTDSNREGSTELLYCIKTYYD